MSTVLCRFQETAQEIDFKRQQSKEKSHNQSVPVIAQKGTRSLSEAA